MVTPTEPRRTLVLDLAITTLVTTIALAVVMRAWSFRLDRPIEYDGDALLYARDARVLSQGGWVQSAGRLGAPFSQEMWDYPISGDNGNYVVMWLLSLLTGDNWVLLVNLFFIATFYTVAWSAYLCLRWLRCGRSNAVVCSVVYAFAPYHFSRGVNHLMLSSYWVVPVGVLLAVRASTGTPLIMRRRPGHELSRRARVAGSVPWIVLCVACASFGSYYFFFTVITIALASTFVAVSRRSIRPVLAGAAYCVVIGTTFVIHIAPNLIHRVDNGVNLQVARRSASESDFWGLRVVQMITPTPGHVAPPLRWVSDRLREGAAAEDAQYFGGLATIGLVAMLAWLLLRIMGKPERAAHDDSRPLLAVLTVVWMLIATTGGLSWLTNLVGFTQLRAWTRVSILLMFLALAWLALTVDPIVRRAFDRHRITPRLVAVAATTVLVLALVDQSGSTFRPDTRSNESAFDSDAAFFREVEAVLPVGSMVYQLPYRRFPEEFPTVRSGDYHLFRPYLHTDRLRFSYGGMKGRESDWQLQLAGAPTEKLVRDVFAVGYDAILIDRFGYEDGAMSIENEIADLVGRQPTESADSRWAFVDLSDVGSSFGTAQELALRRTKLLAPPPLEFESCGPWEWLGSERFTWCGTSGTIRIGAEAAPIPEVSLAATIVAPAGPGTLTLSSVDRTVVDVGPAPTEIEIEFSGTLEITFVADVPRVEAPGDDRDLRFQLIDPEIRLE